MHLTHKALSAVDVLIIVLYFCVIFAIGFYFSRKERTSTEYFLAGRKVGWFAIGASLFVSNISTEHFIGSFGQDRPQLGSLSVPKSVPEEVQTELRARGHVVTLVRGGVGGVALIGMDPKARQATAVGPAADKME